MGWIKSKIKDQRLKNWWWQVIKIPDQVRDDKKRRFWPVGVFLLAELVIFWRFFSRGEIPFPGDSVIGTYYPWLNQDWGYPTGVPVKNPLMTDVPSLLYPWRLQAVEYWKAGEIPLWDPSSFMGMSLIGNFQAGIFNPFNVVFGLVDSFALGWGLQVIVQPLIAMLGMYWLVRRWGMSRMAGTMAGLVFGLSGQMLIWMEYNVHGFVIGLFPWWVGLIHLGLSRDRKWWAGLSIVVMLTILYGYPQFLFYFVIFGWLYLFGYWWKFARDGGKSRWWNISRLRKILKQVQDDNLWNMFRRKTMPWLDVTNLWIGSIWYCVWISLGLLLAGIQLYPGLEALGRSIRNVEISSPTEGLLYWPWQMVVTWLAPDFYGSPGTYNYWGPGYYESYVGYASVVGLLLAVGAWRVRNYRWLVKILSGFLLVLLLLLVESPISWSLQQWAPGMHGGLSSRALFVYGFVVAGSGAVGLEGLLVEKRMHWRNWSRGLNRGEWGLLLVFGTVVIGVLGGYLEWWRIGEWEMEDLYVSLRNLAWPVLVLGVATGVALAVRFTGKKWLIGILFLLVILDMGRFGKKYLPFVAEENIFPITEILMWLQERDDGRLMIERGELLPANMWSPYDLESLSGYNIMVPQKNLRYLSYLNRENLDGGYVRFVDVEQYESQLSSLANGKYLMALKREEGVPDADGELSGRVLELGWPVVFEEGPVVILENPEAVDKVYGADLVLPVEVVDEADAELLALRLMNLEGFDVQRTVVIEQWPGEEVVGHCDVEVLEDDGQWMKLRSICTEDGIGVVVEANDGNWVARVNGEEVPIWDTNMLFMGLHLPAGEAELELRYVPMSLLAGGFMSGLGLAMWTGAWWVVKRRE